MNKLTEDYIDKMWSRRKQYRINMPELAEMLNCKHEHIVSVQMGKSVPDEVYNAVKNWLEVFDLAERHRHDRIS
jgi:ribosome-binding protein aMBF1 (putative translation factor)